MKHVKKDEAKVISELALGVSRDLNQILIELLKDAPPEKVSELKKMIGALMGGVLLDILHPLYDEHPYLAPEAIENHQMARGGRATEGGRVSEFVA